MSRRINLNTLVVPDPQLCGWFEANGIDPGTIPMAQEVLVDGDQLTYVEFEADDDGHLKIAYDNAGEPYRPQRIVTRTILSAPEDHNL